MSNVLVLGVGPLPVDPTEHLHAPGIRVWHLAQVLHQQRHSVVLGIIEFGDFQDNPDAPSRPRQESLGDRISVCRFRYHSQRTPEALATLHTRSRFNCVVSTTDIMNDVAARMPARLPLWLDYLGDPFAERQLQAATFGSDASLLDLWRFMSEALIHGDRFSVASTPQKFTLIGQLGLAGRLNQFTAGLELVHVIPNSSRLMAEKPAQVKRPLKGSMIPLESFLVLWSGGYNTWTDPDTLFRGLESAMREDPAIYFVSVGGEIPGHDNVTFKRFRDMCEASPLSSHFLFVGWVSPDEMPNYYAQADAAINIDLPCYEAEIGTRTRIVDWVQSGIPVITTPLCEPARLLAQRELLEPFEPGSPQSLAQAVLSVKRNLDRARARALVAREFLDELFREEKTFAPLLEWAAAPQFAPDRTVPDPRWAGLASGPLLSDSLVARRNIELLGKFGAGRPRFRPGARKLPLWRRLVQPFSRRQGRRP